MNDFSPVVVKFKDESKEIDVDDVLEVAARIESVLPFGECMQILSNAAENPEGLRVARLASGYFLLLKNAGFEVSKKEALQALMQGDGAQNGVDSLMSLFGQFSDDLESEVKKTQAEAP